MAMQWADGTALELFERLDAPALELPGLPRGLAIGDTLELCGEPSTGKTALAMEAVVRCALPAACGGVRVGGHGACAVVIDTEGDFDLQRLAAALRTRLAEAGVVGAAAEAEAAACLRRVFVMDCLTPRELTIGLCTLCTSLDSLSRRDPARRPAVPPVDGAPAGERPADPPLVEPPRLIVLDGASAFPWTERAAVPRGAAPDASTAHDRAGRWAAELHALVDSLRVRASVVWTRRPPMSHDDGRDFPSLQGVESAALRPLLRLRLRRVESTDARVQLRFQSLLDAPMPALGATSGLGMPVPPVRQSMELAIRGVTTVA
jgi:hypothetical protein